MFCRYMFKVQISCVVVANGMDILLPLCFKPRFVKYFGNITWVYVLHVWKLMTDFLMTLLNTCHIQVTPKIIYENNVAY